MDALTTLNQEVAPSLQLPFSQLVGTASTQVCFGPYELDTKAGELRIGELRVVLQNQLHKILLMLIERPGNIVTRDEIRKQLWTDDTIVCFENSINQAIRKLRRLLNDSADNPKYIETIGRRGYRLKASVKVVRKVAPTLVDNSTASNGPLLQLFGDAFGLPDGTEELKTLAAALIKLVKVLAESHPEKLEAAIGEVNARPALNPPGSGASTARNFPRCKPGMVNDSRDGPTPRAGRRMVSLLKGFRF